MVCTVNRVPPTLVRNTSLNCSAVISPSGVNSPPPALAKRTSRPFPRAAIASATLARSSTLDDVCPDAGGAGADRRHRGVDPILIAPGEEHVGAFGGQALGGGQADPGAAAGHQRRLSVELVVTSCAAVEVVMASFLLSDASDAWTGAAMLIVRGSRSLKKGRLGERHSSVWPINALDPTGPHYALGAWSFGSSRRSWRWPPNCTSGAPRSSCGIGQPTLSDLIRRLERELGADAADPDHSQGRRDRRRARTSRSSQGHPRRGRGRRGCRAAHRCGRDRNGPGGHHPTRGTRAGAASERRRPRAPARRDRDRAADVAAQPHPGSRRGHHRRGDHLRSIARRTGSGEHRLLQRSPVWWDYGRTIASPPRPRWRSTIWRGIDSCRPQRRVVSGLGPGAAPSPGLGGLHPPEVVLDATDLSASGWTNQPEATWVLLTASLGTPPRHHRSADHPGAARSLHPAVEPRTGADRRGRPLRPTGPDPRRRRRAGISSPGICATAAEPRGDRDAD